MNGHFQPTSNGIPLLGLGTYPLAGAAAQATVKMALDAGIRHIDTAQMYGNEKDVGTAISQHGLDRGSLFVVTKVDPGNVGPDRFAASVRKSIDDLGGPVDLLLIHWPPADHEIDGALDRLAAEKQEGNTKSIGISNFSPGMMRKAQSRLPGQLICNQVEYHPLLDQRAVKQAAEETGMVLAAYSPLARGAAFKPEIVQRIAQKHGRPPSEIVLRWIIQQGVVAIPMTTKHQNLESNIRALSFSLPEEDMAAISTLGTADGRTINPGWMAGRWEN